MKYICKHNHVFDEPEEWLNETEYEPHCLVCGTPTVYVLNEIDSDEEVSNGDN